MQNENVTTGVLIKNARVKAGMTQKQLAEKSEMADSAIRKYESGRIVPKIRTLSRIAAALQIPTSSLMVDPNISSMNEFSERYFYAIEELCARIRRKARWQGMSYPIDPKTIKQWIHEYTPEISKKYVVSDEFLSFDGADIIIKHVNDSHYLREIDDLPYNFQEIINSMYELNEEGQKIAVLRVEELAQIPKYQRQQDTPAGQGEEEAETKK